MPETQGRQVLKGLRVKEAMRRLVTRLPQTALLAEACRTMIKYKVNAALVTDSADLPVGVVSKTDLMTAYYAGIPLGRPVAEIMVGPPRYCRPEDSLDAALDQMRAYGIHRLYVREGEAEPVCGVLAYPDIVGMLYRYCHRCDKSLVRRDGGGVQPDRFAVREVMTPQVYLLPVTSSLGEVMAGLAAYKFGAVPLVDEEGGPVGVVSKTDLVTAYLHALPPEARAESIMNRPVLTCQEDEPLLEVIHRLIYWDLHRIFVYKDKPQNLVGVFSLSDAARFRSGSCRACLVSRIQP